MSISLLFFAIRSKYGKELIQGNHRKKSNSLFYQDKKPLVSKANILEYFEYRVTTVESVFVCLLCFSTAPQTMNYQGSKMAQNSSETLKAYNTHILLVDHDKHSVAFTARMLAYFAYIVTVAETGSTAMDFLSNEANKFDLMLMETQLPDLDSFSLLDMAVECGISTILMLSDHRNAMIVKMGLQRGACFYLEKPFTYKMAEGLWLHLAKDKMTKVKSTSENVEANSNVSKTSSSKREARIPWTDELHHKFVKAIHQLGNLNCYPSDILELMNEPGLTRRQVCSHLQKCRNGNWSKLANNGMEIPEPSKKKEGPRKYGLMPALLMPSNIHENQAAPDTNGNVLSELNFRNETLGDREV